MRVLHVVHDFLPLHVAGVEVYTDHLTRRLAADHEVGLLYGEAVPDAPNYALRRGRHGAVKTWELVNNYRFRRFEERWRNPAVARRVREVFDEFRPDLVHVQHLLNFSIDVVSEADRRDIPTVMTLHDHWLACAHGGQRFHRELGRCEVLDAARCGECTAHMTGLALRTRGLLQRPRAGAARGGPILSLAQLQPAATDTPDPRFVYLDAISYAVDGAARPTWVAHPPTRLGFRVATEQGGTFATHVAMHPSTFDAEGGAVRFQIAIDGALRCEHVLDPKRRPEDQSPALLQVKLEPGERWIELTTEAVPPERADHCTAGWVAPGVVCSTGVARPVERLLLRPAARLAGLAARLAERPQARRVEQRWQAMRRLGATVDLFLAPSQYLQREMVRFGLPAARVQHCDYGFAVEEFRKREDLPPVARRFAFVGSLVRHKGVHILLEAFESMPPDAHLEVAGSFDYDPVYSDSLRRAVRHPGVRFVGGVPPAGIPAFLTRADALVVPSIWNENSPLTIHEAFLTGIPVVAARMGGSTELVAAGGGLLYDADDPAALAKQLRRLYEEVGLAQRLARSAPRVKSMETHVSELLGYYESVLSERKARRVRG